MSFCLQECSAEDSAGAVFGNKLFVLTCSRSVCVCVCVCVCVRERERESTLLHKDKELSTSQLFYKFVLDDKHSNTQYVKQYK